MQNKHLTMEILPVSNIKKYLKMFQNDSLNLITKTTSYRTASAVLFSAHPGLEVPFVF